MPKEKNLFNGRFILKPKSKDDEKIYEIVTKYMEENNISTFTGALKAFLIDSNKKQKPKENINIHYWIPVSKDDIPQNIIDGGTTS